MWRVPKFNYLIAFAKFLWENHVRIRHLIIFICLPLQVTQLKIVSNPFAKGFRDNDTNDEWVNETSQISYPWLHGGSLLREWIEKNWKNALVKIAKIIF